jgi:hypothetical protein
MAFWTGLARWTGIARHRGTGRQGRISAVKACLAAAGFAVAGAMAMLPAGHSPATAQDVQFFRIGTGTTGGTYFPIGGLIANIISNPPGGPACEQGGSCGVEGLIAVAQASSGSVDNIARMRDGDIESGLAQADIATWAYSGTALYEDEGAFAELRAIAHLYNELVHVVVREGSDIDSVADLAGRRVSMGDEGSGTLIDARLIFEAYGLGPGDFEALYMPPQRSADALVRGEIDAFVFVGGAPLLAVEDLARRMPIRLLPFDDPIARALTGEVPFLTMDELEAGIYPGVPPVQTLAVGAHWVTRADIDDDLVFGITRALWHPSSQVVLANAHERGSEIRLEDALSGIAIPLHPGAERFYREAGLIETFEMPVRGP